MDENQEYDVSDSILEWYKKVYSGDDGLGYLFDLENPCREDKRPYYKTKEGIIFDNDAKQIEISGDIIFTCELKVCSTKKPWNPTAPPALPAVPELSALCVIRAPAIKGGKNVSENNA